MKGWLFATSFPNIRRAEKSEFTFSESAQAYFISWTQGPYRLLPLRNWPDESKRTLTLRLKNGWYACLAEAQRVEIFSIYKKRGIKGDKFGFVEVDSHHLV